MRRSRAALVLAFVALVSVARPSAQDAGTQEFVTGEILVKFRPGASASAQADVHRQNGGVRLAEIARTRIQRVSVTGSERGALERYRRNPNVSFAELNVIRRIDGQGTASTLVPGDHYFPQQWALHNTGQLFYCIPWVGGELCFYVGTPDADIDAPEAWAVSTGSAVPVAVIDTGIDYTHPDLAANYGGGYDFVSLDPDPADDHGHGTHVSGTIAGAMNNLTGDPGDEEGIVGVAPNARILAYKVCNASGSCSDFAIASAIAQAVTDGAKVINMSLGAATYSQALDDAVQDAWMAGLVIVAGAGNSGVTTPFYPAALNNVVSVGASDEDDLRASFSNYGSWVDIAAPGNVIVSSYPMSGCTLSTTPGDQGCYAFNSGTSMASPHVAGAAALVWSRSDVSLNQHVVDLLLSSADAHGAGAVPVNSWTVHGRLNLHGAMTYLASDPVPNQPPVAAAGADRTVTDSDGDGGVMVILDGSASSDPDGDAITYRWLESGSVIGTGVAPGVFFTVGAHTVTLEVTDPRGAIGTDNVTITVASPPPPPTPTLSVTAISPNTLSQRAGTVTLTITGTAFAAGATVGFANGSGPAPRVLSVTRDSATQLSARVEIRSGGPKTVRRWDVVVTNPDGSSAVGPAMLTITP